WWTNKHPSTSAAATTPAAPKILSVTESQIQQIRLSKPGSPPVVLKKLADKWAIAEPKAMPADKEAVDSLTSSMATLNADRLIDPHPANLAQFGLESPREEVDLTLKDGKTDKLLLGADTPSGSDSYAKLESKPAVYTVASFTKSSFDKSVNDLRDKRLLPFDQDKVTSVALTAKGSTVEFGKNGQGQWQITKPKPYRADNGQVDDLVRKLKDARMDLSAGADDEKKNAQAFAGATRVATAVVTDNNGPETIEVRKAKDNSYYAKSSAAEGIYKISGDLGDGLDKTVDDFRNKKLFDFGFTDPTHMEINGVAYQKSGDKWMSGSTQEDSSTIQTVIDRLRDLSAFKFAEKMTGTPVDTIAVTYGDNHKNEKVSIDQNGNEYYAQREGEPSVYVIGADPINELHKAIAAIKPAQAAKSGNKK
ncbi:MAG TPA: DUF4340 domain-containing protein, partial [Bryobacteraceae bacterium]|nr:DUF4340 domain-containing protein [Bryobacteraceae bacterium]